MTRRRYSPARECRRLARLAQVLAHLLAGAFVTRVVFIVIARLSVERADEQRRRLARWWTQRLCRILGIEIQIEGQRATSPALLVANHVSWIDIPCLLAVVDATFVAKQDVAAWPVVGDMARRIGTIFLARGGRTGAADAADQMTWKLASRHRVIVFPEGTTTDGTSVKPFHARLFQAAIRTQSPVQAIAVRYYCNGELSRVAPFVGDDNLFNHLWTLLGEDAIVARLVFCPLRHATGDRRSLADHAQYQVSAVLAATPMSDAIPKRIMGSNIN